MSFPPNRLLHNDFDTDLIRLTLADPAVGLGHIPKPEAKYKEPRVSTDISLHHLHIST